MNEKEYFGKIEIDGIIINLDKLNDQELVRLEGELVNSKNELKKRLDKSIGI